jgi:hypothetical protein
MEAMMLIVGELINTSRKPIREAVERRDAGYIQRVAKLQEEGGAHYLWSMPDGLQELPIKSFLPIGTKRWPLSGS